MLTRRRRTLLLTAAPALGLSLAACGGPAINTDYKGPLPYTPSATSTADVPAAPSPPLGHQHKAHRSPSDTSPGSETPSATTSAPHTTKPTPPPATASAAPPSSGGGTHTITPTNARITVTPSTGLVNGQTVTIKGKNFDPSIKVIAVQCIDKGTSTGPGDCNINLLALPKGITPAADGTFTTTLTVVSKVHGTACSTSAPCLVSVTDPTPNPSIEADAPISFR